MAFCNDTDLASRGEAFPVTAPPTRGNGQTSELRRRKNARMSGGREFNSFC